jgi:hypothetical protein
MRKYFGGAALCIALFATGAFAEGNWSAGIRDGGGGFYLTAPDQSFHLNFVGYGQFVGSALSSEYSPSDRPDNPVGFQLRRARIATLATVARSYEFMFEIGTPTYRVLPTTAFPQIAGAPGDTAYAGLTGFPIGQSVYGLGPSDVGLVEARITAPIFEDALQIRAGKFIGPFSRENSRSSRSLDTIERSSFLNSVNTIPQLDTQVGVMLFGRALNGVINYYFAVFNGNADSLKSPIGGSGFKEFQLKAVFQPHPSITFGFGYDTYNMGSTVISLVDHAFVPVVSGGLFGVRHGLEFDLDWQYEWFSLRTETDFFTFQDMSGNPIGMRSLTGSYLQLGFQAWGDPSHGVQLIGRGEWARAIVDRVHDLYSAVIGVNVAVNANVSNMLNYILEVPSTTAGTASYAKASLHHILYDQLMLKF